MWIKQYLNQYRYFRAANNVSLPWTRVLRDAWRWKIMHNAKTTPLADGLPWMTFAAIRFLERHINKNSTVFEWGMGGSTRFFLSHAGRVVSVEHDPAWFELVRKEMLPRYADRWTPRLLPPSLRRVDGGDDSDPDSYWSSDEAFVGQSFEEYCRAIVDFPGSFDVVVVDGRARPACVKHGAQKVARGGLLILDNAERENYHKAVAALLPAEWTFTDLSGAGPYNGVFWSTWAWRRR